MKTEKNGKLALGNYLLALGTLVITFLRYLPICENQCLKLKCHVPQNMMNRHCIDIYILEYSLKL